MGALSSQVKPGLKKTSCRQYLRLSALLPILSQSQHWEN